MTFAAGVVHKWVSTMGEEVLVLPVGDPHEYQVGRAETALVPCLVLFTCRKSDWQRVGHVMKFAVVTLKPLL